MARKPSAKQIEALRVAAEEATAAFQAAVEAAAEDPDDDELAAAVEAAEAKANQAQEAYLAALPTDDPAPADVSDGTAWFKAPVGPIHVTLGSTVHDRCIAEGYAQIDPPKA